METMDSSTAIACMVHNGFKTNVPSVNNTLIGDNGLYTALTAYGLYYRGYVIGLSPDTVVYPGQYAYLSYISLYYQQAPSVSNNTLPAIFNQTDLIYSNSGSKYSMVPKDEEPVQLCLTIMISAESAFF